MKDTHIISLLESAPLANLSDSEMAVIRAHVANCVGCQRSFEAVQISVLLIKERAAEEIEPSPFFQTRVLAALREQHAAAEMSASSLWRLWKATGALVSGMAATVAALAVFTFVAPSGTEPPDAASAFDSYSAEEVILSRDDLPNDDLSYDQVLAAIYESDEDAER